MEGMAGNSELNGLYVNLMGIFRHFLMVFVFIVLLVGAFIVWSVWNFNSIQFGWYYLQGYRVVAIEKVIDCGTVKVGDYVQVPFRLKNISGNEITIIGAKADCHCVVLSVSPIHLPKDEEYQIKFQFTAEETSETVKVEHVMFVFF